MPRDVVSLGAYRARSPRRAAKLAEMGDGRGIVRVAEAVVAVANGNATQAHELVEVMILEAKAR